MPRRWMPVLVALALALVGPAAAAPRVAATTAVRRPTPDQATPADLKALRREIRRGWRALRRSVLGVRPDAKVGAAADARPLLWVPITHRLRARERAVLAARGVEVRRFSGDPAMIEGGGMLYVPHRYLVPGGRFEELFGWDAHFGNLGLLAEVTRPRAVQQGLRDLLAVRGLARPRKVKTSRRLVRQARRIVENHLFEVRHYGMVLNSNRAWSGGRSQPPYLTQMILDVHEQTGDDRWAAATLDAVEAYHAYWTTGDRVSATGRTPGFPGLSRYADAQRGPPPEVTNAGTGEYERVKQRLRARLPPDRLARYVDPVTGDFTDEFWRNDRAMRASGEDRIGERWGVTGEETADHNPVELQALLYKMEVDGARIATMAGRPDRAREWRRRAEERRRAIKRFHIQDGWPVDRHIESGRPRRVVNAIAFTLLRVGALDRDDAARVSRNLLRELEGPGGLFVSADETGDQWGKPFVFANLMVEASDGLRRYGFHRDADRIGVRFLSMVLRDFMATGSLWEKYDGRSRDSDVSDELSSGYTTNEPGFLWTNAAFVHLYDRLSPDAKRRVLDLRHDDLRE